MSTLLVADIGGTTVKIGFVVEGIPQTYERVFPSSHLRRPDPVAGLAELIFLAIDEAKLQPHTIVSTVPGFLDKTARHVLLAVNIPELNGCALVDELARETGIPVTLERDAVLALMGEHAAGGCRGAKSVLGFFFGTGVGAAYLQNGSAFRGGGWALEVGHMPYHGSHRWLGADRTDCLEAYVSGKVLERIAQEHGVVISEEIFPLQVFEQMQGEISGLFGGDRAQTQVVIVGRLLRDVAAGAYHQVGYPEFLADLAQRRGLHFDDIGVKVGAQRVDTLLCHAEQVGGGYHAAPHLYLVGCTIGRNLVAAIGSDGLVGELEHCIGRGHLVFDLGAVHRTIEWPIDHVIVGQAAVVMLVQGSGNDHVAGSQLLVNARTSSAHQDKPRFELGEK
jgi:hypothetical protein